MEKSSGGACGIKSPREDVLRVQTNPNILVSQIFRSYLHSVPQGSLHAAPRMFIRAESVQAPEGLFSFPSIAASPNQMRLEAIGWGPKGLWSSSSTLNYDTACSPGLGPVRRSLVVRMGKPR